MALTAAEHLELVDAAIARALTSQEYEVGAGQNKRRQVNAKLDDLRKHRESLLAEIAASSGGGSMATLAEMEIVR